MISRPTTIVLVSAQVMIILGLVVVALLLGRDRIVERHLIPAGYVGWVVVEYEVPGEAPLPTEGDAVVFRYSGEGRLRTSSSLRSEWTRREYFYIDERGSTEPLRWTLWEETGMIWGLYNASEVITVKDGAMDRGVRSGFFVGSPAQYEAAETGRFPWEGVGGEDVE